MKTRILAAVLTLAGALSASAAVETVLTSDGTIYSIDGGTSVPRLELTRRTAEGASTIIVPTTYDEAIESDARLLWDDATATLFLAWHRRDDSEDDIRFMRLNSDQNWSEPVVITKSGSDTRRVGLQIVLSRAAIEEDGVVLEEKATLLHATWWNLNGNDAVAEYALSAFEQGLHVSTEVTEIDLLDDGRDAADAVEAEDTGNPAHPPMALSRAENGVDVVYGRKESTAVRRIRIEPRRVASQARAWRPLGKVGDKTGPARLISTTSAPVQAFVTNGRIVLYTPDTEFRFTVFDKGAWSPLRMIKLDESLTGEQLVQHLRRSVEEMVTAGSTAAEE